MTPVHELAAVPNYSSSRSESAALVHHSASTLASTELRPWGSFSVLEEATGYKIKRIEVKPGHRLSLQMHHHRSEHWIVVSGTAKVVCGDDDIVLCTNQSTYVPPCTNHRLENPGVIPLILIEVQNGEYLGEDDIVRFQDDYARVQGA
ncbi:MAG: phosphomannose isomerase type II C-terminal cupin domain [Phormidesmis sp. CAN_BIN44]|nr:phosphomannose isomerase type II C-terminal cupin domain [Phormidesmis sp. CAN_BIN44]